MRPLRKLLVEQSFPLLLSSGRLALDACHLYCDLTQFEQLYLLHTPQSYRQAVALYKAPLLLDPPYDWSIEYASYYDVRFFEMLEYLSDYYMDSDPALALTYRKMQEEYA